MLLPKFCNTFARIFLMMHFARFISDFLVRKIHLLMWINRLEMGLWMVYKALPETLHKSSSSYFKKCTNIFLSWREVWFLTIHSRSPVRIDLYNVFRWTGDLCKCFSGNNGLVFCSGCFHNSRREIFTAIKFKTHYIILGFKWNH